MTRPPARLPHTPTTETCFLHDERTAIEHCEVCQRPVCGSCLWYAESGERLCPIHADAFRQQGRRVLSPDQYARGIAFSELSVQTNTQRTLPPPYQGNSSDVMALVSLVMGVAALLSCAGYAFLLPVLAFILGMSAWLNQRLSLNPRRTGWMAGIGMTSGGVFILGFLVIVACCGAFYMISIAATTNSGSFSPTPIPSFP